ncbi:MAG: EAL domain-containing protein [Granulosicoccus sp.]
MNETDAIQRIKDIYHAVKESPRLLCTAFLLLFAIPTIFYLANRINYHFQDDKTYQKANAVTQHVGERISVINTVLASMVGLHDVSSDLDYNKLLRFSDDILKNARYIKNLGRYEKITHEQRDTFESIMSHNGYSDFSIARINEIGRFSAQDKQDTYYPISVAGPVYATIPGLIGTDFRALPGFSEAIENMEISNASTIIELPDAWPLKGDLIALRPIARKDSSEPASHTASQTGLDADAGGFWLTLNLERMFSGLTKIVTHFDISINLVNANGSEPVYSARNRSGQTLFLTWLYPKKSVEEVWTISSSTKLVITLERSVGLTLITLVFTIASTFLVILISCSYTKHVVDRRQSEIEHIEGLQNLFREREKAEKTLNSVQDAIITLDAELRIVHINPAAVIQFNTRASAIVGQPIQSLAQFHRATDDTRLLNLDSELRNVTHNSKKELDVIPAGHVDEDFVLRMSLSSSRDHEGVVTGHVMVLRDISHERRLTRKLAYQANYDALTGCTNRYFFEQSLERLIEEMPSTGLTHTLCYMDLDQFKIVNDTCGHRAGDQLLIELTKSLQLMIRDQDILSRLGGDEFGLILVGVDKEAATAVATRIYEFFQKYIFTHQGNTFSITASIGVVHIDTLCANSKDVMAAADIACYEAKDSGRNSMSIYSENDEGMTERSEELNWLPRLQTALHNNEFRLHVQAVASLTPARDEPLVTHFEFLLRLADKDGLEVTPWQFIQAAERYDLMRDIDRWVIRNALQNVAQQSTGPGSNCSFSINLSGQSAADPTLKSFIQNQFQVHKVDPSRIWFELTETAAISHFSVAVDLIKSIRTTGAKVALDDFGSGLSSFGYLKNLPVDIIKIDGQFVKEIVRNPIDREMVRAIHRVGESMNIETVAEFVEDLATVEELRRIGVNYAQGYYIGRPAPVDQAIASLTNKPKAA